MILTSCSWSVSQLMRSRDFWCSTKTQLLSTMLKPRPKPWKWICTTSQQLTRHNWKRSLIWAFTSSGPRCTALLWGSNSITICRLLRTERVMMLRSSLSILNSNSFSKTGGSSGRLLRTMSRLTRELRLWRARIWNTKTSCLLILHSSTEEVSTSKTCSKTLSRWSWITNWPSLLLNP